MTLHEEIEELFVELQGGVQTDELAADIEQGCYPGLRIVEIGEIESAQDIIDEIKSEDKILGIDYWDLEYWEDISQILPDNYDDYPNDLNIPELIQALKESGEIQSLDSCATDDAIPKPNNTSPAIQPIRELSAARFDIPESVAYAFSIHARQFKQQKDPQMDNRTLSLLGLHDNASCEEVYQAVKNLTTRLERAETTLLHIEADKVVEQNKNRIANPEEFKKLYVKHGKDIAMSFLNVMYPPTTASQPPTPVSNAIADAGGDPIAIDLIEGLEM